MSSANRPSSNWLTQNYDKLAMVVALVLLLGSSVALVLRINAGRSAGAAVAEAPGGGAVASPVDMSVTQGSLDLLNKAFQVPVSQQRLMVGELRVACVTCGKPIPYNATVCPFDGSPQPAVGSRPDTDGDGIPDQDELKLGLNPNDASDGRADLDGDGFRNDEEYRYGTDLKDATSFPPVLAKLRVTNIVTKPFKLRFLAVSELKDGVRYQLNLRSLDKTYFAKMGDEVEGYKVASFEPKSEQGPTLYLEREGKRVALIMGQVIQQDQREATLILLIDRQMFQVIAGSEIKLKDKSYKVVDINDNRVLIRDEEAGTDTPVGLASEEERQQVQSGAAGSATP